MNGDLVSVLLWNFLTVLAVFLTVGFGYVFYKDRDKRKLMFMLAFAFASFTYLPKMQTAWENIQVIERLYYWSSLPLVSAVLIAVLSSLLKLEDFDKSFKAFLLIVATSIFMILVPLPVQPARSLLFQGMSMIVIAMSIYLILTRKKVSDVMFLLSMVCFTSAGLGMARGLSVEFSVFADVFAYVFIVLVFPTSKESGKGGISSFFALRRELEKTQEELRESEEKYRRQFEEAMDAIFVADAETGIIVDCNRAASELVGREKSELVGKHQQILHPPQEIEGESSRTFKQHLKEKEGRVLEAQVITKEGEIKEVAIKANVLELRGKKLIQGIFRDITEWKKAEEEMIRLSSAVKMSTDSIVISDIDGKIVDVNEATLKMYGTEDKGDLIGKNSFDLIALEERERALTGLKEVLEKGFLKIREYHVVTKDGGRIPVEMSVALMKDADGKPIGFVGISRDITERRKMEEALKRQRDIAITLSGAGDLSEALNRLFDNLLEIEEFDCAGFYLVDEDTGDLDMIVHRGLPDAFVEKVGHLDADSPYTKVAMGSKPIYLKTSDFPPAIRKDLQSDGILAAAAIPIEHEGEIIGDLNMASHTCDEISASTRNVLESVGAQIGENIARARIEEKLRESEEKYRNLFENARDIIVTFDLKGNVTSINKAATEYWFKKDEIVGKNRLKFVPKKYWPRLLKELAKLAQGNPVEGEMEVITPKGKRIGEYRANPIRQGKKVVGIQEILRDVTERKKMEEKLNEYAEHLEEMVAKRTRQLKESEEKYRSLFENANDVIVQVDLTGKILDVNRRVEELTGRKREEVLGKNFLRLGDVSLRDVPKVLSLLRRKVTGKTSTHLELTITRKDGEKRFVEVNSIRMPKGVVAVVRDITQRKKAEEQLLKTEKLAAIGELATMVGHDLRNPLQSIENATYYLNNELSRLHPSVPIPRKTKEMLQVINDSINYADKIIRDLQDFSATRKPTLEKTDINAIVNHALSQVEAPENVELVIELGNLPKIKIDKDMIKRTFLNLATNGIQAMENRGTLKVTTKKTEGFVDISFQDTGVGISKENKEKIFTPFFTTKAKGMGMGLAICKRFIESLGGSIEVESQEGKGSTFTVKLPIQRENGGENQWQRISLASS